MKKTAIKVIPEYGKMYVNYASDADLMEQLPTSGIEKFILHKDKLQALENKVYAQGKWTVKEIMEHLADAERVFQYRVLRFARQDKTPLSGFDEDLWVAVSKANNRSIEQLIDEMKIVRQSTVKLFETLSDEELLFTGTANDTPTSVLALGFMIIGHSIHHFNVIEERYFPLLS